MEPRTSPPRILIADDDAGLLNLMVMRVRRLEFEPDTAADGARAAELIQANEYDLIVTDINMPGRNGLELLKLARERDPYVQVVIVTGGASMDSAIQALNSGAFGYLIKPFDHMSVLENSVRRALEFRHLTLDNIRMAEIQRRRSDLLEQEVADRLKQVNRQDREIRQILSHLPEGILILGGHRGTMPANPSARAWLSKDAVSTDKPISAYLQALRQNQAADRRLVELGGRTLELRAVELSKDPERESRIVLIRDLSMEGRAVCDDLKAPLANLAQGLANLMADGHLEADRETILFMARQLQALEALRSAFDGVPVAAPIEATVS